MTVLTRSLVRGTARFVEAWKLRSLFLATAYAIICVVSFYLAFELRFDFALPENWRDERVSALLWFLPWKLICLHFCGQFRGLLSYFRLPDLYRLVLALIVAVGALFVGNYLPSIPFHVPRGVILTDFVLSLLLLGAFRVIMRVVREKYIVPTGTTRRAVRRSAIMGAGDVGATVVADMLARPSLGLKPTVFFDDDAHKWKHNIHGVPVVGAPEELARLKTRYGVDNVIIAMPNASQKRVKEILEIARAAGLPTETVPSLADLTSGRMKATRLRPLEIEDLLGRDSISLNDEAILNLMRNEVVMVTGAGGSIGAELCRQILRQQPARLVLIEQCEVQLFEVEQRLLLEGGGGIIVPEIADILDEPRMRAVFNQHRPVLIFHAAAHKHVPLMERQPAEAIKNNSLGTALMVSLAREYLVREFVLISTDKAVNPTNVMGASKRIAELCLQAEQQLSGHRTRFAAVRFGNVLGSSGSVVPVFRRQIAQGGPVKVTHPDVTRYFMTIPEAVGLVLQCAVQARGGEIFVLNMGQPVKIVDLAKQMIELSGYIPNVDIDIEFTGLRPGEKLFEELQHMGEDYVPTTHPCISRFVAKPPAAEFVAQMKQELGDLAAKQASRIQLREALHKFVPEYKPYVE